MNYLITNKYWEINEDYNKEKLLFALVDRSEYIDKFNNFIWLKSKNLYHREYDLPAVVWNDGEIWWYKNNLRHRKNNMPATVFADGRKEYWLKDKCIKTEQLK